MYNHTEATFQAWPALCVVRLLREALFHFQLWAGRAAGSTILRNLARQRTGASKGGDVGHAVELSDDKYVLRR